MTGFTVDGFNLSGAPLNDSTGNYVAWNWKANPVPTINTDGTIQSFVSANQASGFSVVEWTGDGSASATVGHGLSGTPDFIMLKDLTDVGGWNGAQVGLASNEGISLQSSAAAFTGMGSNGGITYANLSATNFGFATGTSGVDSVNKNGNQYIAYCWKSVAGFSKMASYSGTGAAGNNVTIGFEPSWIMIKRSDSTGGWLMFDNKRNPSNPRNSRLEANNDSAEQAGSTSKFVDFDATSFEPQISDSEINASGGTYLYMAFKENPAPIVPVVIPAGEMAYMVVAGGASGASNGGGGGAGGLRTSYGSLSGGGASAESNISLSSGTYTITIGGGGAETTVYQNAGTNGTATTISGNATVNTVGGGGGGSNNNSPLTGGSGGGSGSGSGGPTGAAGTAGEGFAGGNGMAASHPYTGGGGGGTGAVGGGASSSAPGNGGDGLEMTITGAKVNYGGGGGGTGGTGVGYTGPGGSGGAGGGGNGGAYNSTGIAATVNTGGGGGGSGDNTGVGGAGGSGVVILRMNTADYSGSTTGSPTVTTVDSYTILTYTGSGTYVHS